MTYKISKTDEDWKKQLSPEEFRICRKKDTEKPFTGIYNDCNEKGTYNCLCCGIHLFSSDTKFDSGSGWPSFFKSLNDENIEYVEKKILKDRLLESIMIVKKKEHTIVCVVVYNFSHLIQNLTLVVAGRVFLNH